MPDTPDEREREIAELRARLAALEAQAAAPPASPPPRVRGDATVGGDNSGQVIGVNLGTMILQRAPNEDERRAFADYLEHVAAQLNQLPLRGLKTDLDNKGQGIALCNVYVALATTSTTTLARGTPKALAAYLDDPDDLRREGVTALRAVKKAYHPDYALPAQAVVAVQPRDADTRRRDADTRRSEWKLVRAQLALEAVQQQQRLVLLGDPGSGKSTFVRHLAWLLAQREVTPLPSAQADLLAHWQTPTLPIILPCQRLARHLASTTGDAHGAVFGALQHELERFTMAAALAADLLREGLRTGTLLVLLDGLDEVPLTPEPETGASREATLAAIRQFALTYQRVRIVLTSRVRAFTEDLASILGWPIATLAPFTLGQIRAFVPAWYGELVQKAQLDADTAATLTTKLIERIGENRQLREMAQTPLLLTMMALVLYNKNELPRDRPKLYEDVLDVLLGQWDKVREGKTLPEVIGKPDWTSNDLRPPLHALSYAAHRTGSEDGRGRLPREAVRSALIDFFDAANLSDSWEAAKRCLDYIEQRSGLLMPDGTASYVFAHLTLQEHCAGCYLTQERDDVLAQVLAHRGDDRWHVPLLLGLGLADVRDLRDVLEALLNGQEDGVPKPAARWYRDLILAAELGNDRDWDTLRTKAQLRPHLDPMQATLRQGLVTLLSDPASGLEQRERIRAGALLGELGDPRCPTTLEQWQVQLAQRSTTFGQPHGYFCYVPKGTYAVGGWGEDVQGQPNTPAVQHPLQPYWIARYPITNAQFRPFVEGDGYTNKGYWMRAGWAWRTRNERTAPSFWDDARFNQANQPVVGVTWYEVMAYAAWLTQQLAGALPEGYEIRLPTEAEWEVAAAYDGQGTHRRYPWGDGPEPDGDHAIFEDAQGNNLGAAAPVGVCAAGAAACGAADMTGNVFEWCASSYAGYPQAAADFKKDVTGDDSYSPLRGGSWWSKITYMTCGARYRLRPVDWNYDSFGVRVVCAPRQA